MNVSRFIRSAVAAPFLVCVTTGLASGQEIVFAAEGIARTLALEMREHGKTTVAISSFRELATGQATPVGAFLAEELVTQLTKVGTDLTVIERSRTDAIFDEQQLGLDGLREPGRLDAFVKVLEVEALVVGTITTLPELGGKSRINARLIAVPTGEILASDSDFVPLKDVKVDPHPPGLPRPIERVSRDSWKTLDFEALGCNRRDRDLLCEILVTNNDHDLEVYFYASNSFVYDERGSRYEPKQVKVANIASNRHVQILLVSEVPTRITLSYEGLPPSGVKQVKLLTLRFQAGNTATISLRDVSVTR